MRMLALCPVGPGHGERPFLSFSKAMVPLVFSVVSAARTSVHTVLSSFPRSGQFMDPNFDLAPGSFVFFLPPPPRRRVWAPLKAVADWGFFESCPLFSPCSGFWLGSFQHSPTIIGPCQGAAAVPPCSNILSSSLEFPSLSTVTPSQMGYAVPSFFFTQCFFLWPNRSSLHWVTLYRFRILIFAPFLFRQDVECTSLHFGSFSHFCRWQAVSIAGSPMDHGVKLLWSVSVPRWF